MGTITIPAVSSGTTNAEALNDAYYSTRTTSLKVLNGSLTSDHISDLITHEHIRDQTIANGKMLGNTGNLDFTAGMFATDEGQPGSALAIPGAVQTFYLPYAASLAVFSWQITVTNSQQTTTASAKRRIRAFLDGEAMAGQSRTMKACRTGSNALTGARTPLNDFAWSGHAVRTTMTKGFHTVSLKLFSGSDTMRVRVRNMKVIWFK